MASKKKRSEAGFTVPTDARAAYKAMIQRANRRLKSNLDYIKKNGIKDNEIKQRLAFDYTRKKKWETNTNPFSSSVKFKSEAEYKEHVKHVLRWGEDTGKKGDFRASPGSIMERGRSNIYLALNSMIDRKGISLEEWGGDLPPELKERIEKLNIVQLDKFFEYVDTEGEIEYLDSDQVGDTIDDFIEYINGRLGAVEKFYALTPKGKKKKKSRKKRKKGKKK